MSRRSEPCGALRSRSSLGRAVLARAVVVVVLAVLGACSSGPPSSQSTIEAWASEDLGIPNARTCLGPYLEEVDLRGVSREQLRDEGLEAVPTDVGQRIADALVVCGLSATPR